MSDIESWIAMLVVSLLALVCWDSAIAQRQPGPYRPEFAVDRELPPELIPFLEQNEVRPCYSTKADSVSPQKCTPPFENAAYRQPVDSTNTCGFGLDPRFQRVQFCFRAWRRLKWRPPASNTFDRRNSGRGRRYQECFWCSQQDPAENHSPALVTDFHNANSPTFWLSETLYEFNYDKLMIDTNIYGERPLVEYPPAINLTVDLGKSYELAYVKVSFFTSRPESFSIYKKANPESDWEPFHYFSATCEDTYNITSDEVITSDNQVICTSKDSNVVPLSGAPVVFGPMLGRPGVRNYDTNIVLQEFVTASAIRITLDRPNTFSDEAFLAPKALRSVFYAITDIAVGGRCLCNGHAKECVSSAGGGVAKRVCVCQHNTEGDDCQRCRPMFNDAPWRRGTEADPAACQACDCNGLADRCAFDQALYDSTAHGGRCVGCRENTGGARCEQCLPDHYRMEGQRGCTHCRCDATGSETTQCGEDGKCVCKPGVGGDKCDMCLPSHYDFNPGGCRECACDEAGSADEPPVCDVTSGLCVCKPNVEMRQCDSCKPGYFNLATSDPHGCQSCFCFGHSSDCVSAPGYVSAPITSDFAVGTDGWTAVDEFGAEIPIKHDPFTASISIDPPANGRRAYFVAPAKFVGDQRFSYNQHLSLKLWRGEGSPTVTYEDVILASGEDNLIYMPLIAQDNPEYPSEDERDYVYRLHEAPSAEGSYTWHKKLTSQQFLTMLSGLTQLKITATFGSSVAHLSSVSMESASPGAVGSAASWVEKCSCPPAYVGQFCDECSPGYHRLTPNGGPSDTCIPCQCYNHSDTCDVNTGKCICEHHTMGHSCDRCEEGYYGDPRVGTPDDCTPCPCPGGGACLQLLSGDVACISCPNGTTGNRCEQCSDGWFGNPKEGVACVKCECNGNIDSNAVGNCDRLTGECLRCIYNTGGDYCSRCEDGFFGDALLKPHSNCTGCACYGPGTDGGRSENDDDLPCDQSTGRCACRPNVLGRTCDTCDEGYYNITSLEGCHACNCDPVGSEGVTCELVTGQCTCKPGVTGLHCDECMPDYFAFSADGCKPCECNELGSEGTQCDLVTGQCPCQPSVEGLQCDRCMENKYGLASGCLDCPACYTLVQDAVNAHRAKIEALKNLLKDIGSTPNSVTDEEFEKKLAMVNATVQELLQDARVAAAGGVDIAQQLKDLQFLIEETRELLVKAEEATAMTGEKVGKAHGVLNNVEDTLDNAEAIFNQARDELENEGEPILDDAIEASQKAGQQSARMTEIAKEAKMLAEKHTQQADQVESRAHEALNISRQALDIMREAFSKPGDISDALMELMDQTVALADKINATLVDAEALQQDARAQAREAEKVLEEAKELEVPAVDSDAVLERAKDLEARAEEMSNRSRELRDRHNATAADMDQAVMDAQKLLEEARAHQRSLDALLQEAFSARQDALSAVSSANATLIEAENTLQTLKEFDSIVRQSKTEAEEALKQKDGIVEKIEEANSMTKAAEAELEDATSDALDGAAAAEEAEVTANKAAQQAQNIREAAMKTESEADEASREAKELDDILTEREEKLREREEEKEVDAELAKDTLKRAGEARDVARQVLDTVQQANSNVTKIIQEVESMMMDEGSEESLAGLEKALAEVEASLAARNLQNVTAQIRSDNESQKKNVKVMEGQIRDLRPDVDNIKEIAKSLPRLCPKDVEVEGGKR